MSRKIHYKLTPIIFRICFQKIRIGTSGISWQMNEERNTKINVHKLVKLLVNREKSTAMPTS